MRAFAALLALNIALTWGAPQNNAPLAAFESEDATLARRKGAMETMETMSDSAYVRTCIGYECTMTKVSEAKGLAQEADFRSVQAVKGNPEMTKALQPSLNTMADSIKGLSEQRAMLENLEAQMAALTSASNKGQQLAEQTKGMFAQRMSKGVDFSQMSGPASKGRSFAAPPSKGGSMAANMQLEAAMCPMTMYELGKAQKLSAERKVQLDTANAVNSNLMSEKFRLESALAGMQALKNKAEEQAAFNAKYAAEQKSRAEVAESAHARAEADKSILIQQKGELEQQLSATQDALVQERATTMALTDGLKTCNEEKDALSVALEEQTARAEAAEDELASTKEALEQETSARVECEETLAFTQNRLAKSEDDLNKERAAREQTEEELMKTMTDLAACQRELRVTSEILSRTQDDLQDKTQAYAREQAAREALEAKVASLVEEIRNIEQSLRDTQRALEDEQNAHATTQRKLDETEQELAATEEARRALEEAKQTLEDELAETKAQLEAMTAERDQLQVTLDATSAALAQCTNDKMTCESNLANEKSITEMLSSQLNDAMEMLKMEKEAREQLTATIMQVQEASQKVQEEVKKLQLENLVLAQQVEKLRSEQEVAMAMAAGCPPTYEKFGGSCYKYVREKSQWKMAQEQCMKDSGNLVAIESTEEQIYLTNYLKRMDASDAYSHTSGHKKYNGWKWLGASDNHMGASGVEFWYNEMTKMKNGYDCQAMYLADHFKYGKWVGLPCYSAAHYVCEYNLVPPGTETPSNPAEDMAVLEMAREAPSYLMGAVRRA